MRPGTSLKRFPMWKWYERYIWESDMVGQIKVHCHSSLLRVISGSRGSGKTSLLLGMAAMARSRDRKILWLSTDHVAKHIASYVEDTMIIRNISTLESFLKGPTAPLYDMIVFDDFDRLYNNTNSAIDSIKMFKKEGCSAGQQRICSVSVRYRPQE